MNNPRKKKAARRRKLERIRAGMRPVAASRGLSPAVRAQDALVLARSAPGKLASIDLQGDRSVLTLRAHPAGAAVQAGPDGVGVPPDVSLRCVLPASAPLEAKAMLVEFAFRQDGSSPNGMLLSLIDPDGRNLSLRDMGGSWVLRAGDARLDVSLRPEGSNMVRFALGASGRLFVGREDGSVEEVQAFEPVDILQIRQIHVGNKAPLVLQGLRVALFDTESPDAVRALLEAPHAGDPALRELALAPC